MTAGAGWLNATQKPQPPTGHSHPYRPSIAAADFASRTSWMNSAR